MLELLQLRCRNSEHLFHIALKSFEIWVIFKLFLVLIEILFEFLDILGGVRLHSRHELYALVLRPGKTDLFAIVPTLHAPVYIHIVILNDPQDDVRGRDAFGALGWQEFPSFLDLCVDIFLTDTPVWKVVVCDIVDVVFVEEIKADDPGARADDFIDPFAMLQNVAPLFLIHDNLTLLSLRFLVTRDSYDEVHVGEERLGLFKNARMADVVHVKHSVCVNANWSLWIITIVLARR